jgi:hypothetical protein
VGRCAADLIGGQLPLLVATLSPADPGPLGFAVVSFVSDASIRSLPSARYYPQREPSVCYLGPGLDATVAGSVRVKPRSYNVRWLAAGFPASAWFIRVDAMAPAGSIQPRFTPRSLVLDGVEFGPAGGTGDPALAFPLMPRG